MKISGIYALHEKGTVRYIGQSKDIAKRFSQHCSLVQVMGDTPVKKWLRSLLFTNDRPELMILEETTRLDESEIKWIKKYREDGVRLLNLSDGGQTMTYLRKAKLSKPWGRAMAPIQRRLAHMKQTINLLKRFGKTDMEKQARETYAEVIDAISKVDRDWLNNTLWEKHGR